MTCLVYGRFMTWQEKKAKNIFKTMLFHIVRPTDKMMCTFTFTVFSSETDIREK